MAATSSFSIDKFTGNSGLKAGGALGSLFQCHLDAAKGTGSTIGNFKFLCKGYHAHYENIKHSKNFAKALERCLKSNKASVIEIEIDPKQITTRQRMENINN